MGAERQFDRQRHAIRDNFVGAIFGLVLLHELGHRLMARQYGLAVRDITLLPFGGVARVEQMPASTRVESLVAVAGSLVNLAIAMLALPFMLIWFVLADVPFSELFQIFPFDTPSFGSFVLYLYLANLLLAIINLLPVFPMDGGRVFRSMLSEVIGRAQATRFAVYITGVFAVIASAFAMAGGEWLIVLVSVMLLVFAIAEGRSVRLEENLRRMAVGHFTVWDRGSISQANHWPSPYATVHAIWWLQLTARCWGWSGKLICNACFRAAPWTRPLAKSWTAVLSLPMSRIPFTTFIH
ncbi:MAG: site-2 protease family protein [Thermomicrobiales bacterium]